MGRIQGHSYLSWDDTIKTPSGIEISMNHFYRPVCVVLDQNLPLDFLT